MGSFPPAGDLYRYSLDLRANWTCKGRKPMILQRSIIMNRQTPQAKVYLDCKRITQTSLYVPLQCQLMRRRWLVTYLLEKNDRNDYLELFLELDQHEVPSANLRFTNGIFCKMKKIQIKGQKRMENKINIEHQKRLLNPHSSKCNSSAIPFLIQQRFFFWTSYGTSFCTCLMHILLCTAVVYVCILSLCYIVSSMRAENMPYLNFVSTLVASIEFCTRYLLNKYLIN
ncbi:uncharacterized protein LOC127559433 isoform X2 [Antechinus flavipes]|uniref:uncharacterized protein LOC127559433 isoform X2 n=1 Tax=Antechinus flavipes TaxID=38775 RepID=UPI0022359818|nr:uncharacterized protein LOC127559433 isoform X2 [Antechinus flavipes]